MTDIRDQLVAVDPELVVEPATLINLGFEWLIQGDDNRNRGDRLAHACLDNDTKSV